MPTTSPERRRRWPGMDQQATKFLERNGYVLNADWTWSGPKVDGKTRPVTPREEDAILYLIEEWDFGGLLTDEEASRWPMPRDPYIPADGGDHE